MQTPLKHPEICSTCKKIQQEDYEPYKACSKCKSAYYCCRNCQKAAWQTHKLVCKPFVSFSTDEHINMILRENCRNNYLVGIQACIFSGANVNMLSSDDHQSVTPLFIACEGGNEDCVEFLLQHGADPNLTNRQRFTPLHAACVNGFDNCVKVLLQHSADPNITETEHGVTPLYIAGLKGYDKCMALLLQHGANANITEKIDNRTPLYQCCNKGFDTCVTLLLQHGADHSITTNKEVLTPLHIACHCGYDKCVAILLLQQDIDVNNTYNKFKMTPLHTCCKVGHDKCASLLIQHGADPKLQSLPWHLTPLHSASKEGHINIVKLLAAISFDVIDSRDVVDHTPLYDACSNGFDKIALVLLQAGASITLRGPLHIACLLGHLRCVVLLIEHGADLTQVVHQLANNEDNTCLINCAKAGRHQIMSYLLAHGANIHTLNNKGRTAVQMAHLIGHAKCVKLLVEHGADESSLQGLVFGSEYEVQLGSIIYNMYCFIRFNIYNKKYICNTIYVLYMLFYNYI
jgi:ankyrin repeat protein